MTLYNWDYLYFDKGMKNDTIKIREITTRFNSFTDGNIMSVCD